MIKLKLELRLELELQLEDEAEVGVSNDGPSIMVYDYFMITITNKTLLAIFFYFGPETTGSLWLKEVVTT